MTAFPLPISDDALRASCRRWRGTELATFDSAVRMSDIRPPSPLHDIVQHAERTASIDDAHPSVAAFMHDENARDAVHWRLIAVGEACFRPGDEPHQAHPELPWREVIDQSTLIAHGDDIATWPRITSAIERHLPDFISEARRLLDAYGPPPQS